MRKKRDHGYGGKYENQYQRDRRAGGKKQSQKSKDNARDHRQGGKYQSPAQRKAQFGGSDPNRIDWQTVLVEVVRSNSRPMKIKDIFIEVQKRAKAKGKTVPGWTSFENKFKRKRCKPGTKGKGKLKFRLAWIDQKFSVNTRNKPKKEWMVKLKI